MKKLYFQWHITDACNWRCRHCYQDDFTKKSELKLPGLIKILENIFTCAKKQNSKIIINVTGGEPLLKEEIFEFLDYLNNHERLEKLFIITNASLINEDVLERLSKFKKLKQVKISLDGATREVNDRIRNPGSFDIVLKKIKLIQEKTKFEVVIMLTIMKSNLEQLPLFFKLCQDLGVDGFILERFIPLGQSRNLVGEVVTKSDWQEAIKCVYDFLGIYSKDKDILPSKAFWIKFTPLEIQYPKTNLRSPNPVRNKTPEASVLPSAKISNRAKGDLSLTGLKQTPHEILSATCNLGRDSFAILPNGDLLPCRRFNLKIGNLYEENLLDIIHNYDKLLKEVTNKNNLKGKCRACPLNNCRGCRALGYALYNDYLAEDSQCWIEESESKKAVLNQISHHTP